MGIGGSVSTNTNNSSSIVTDGILLSSIYEFIDDYCNGIDNIIGLTTEYIHNKYIKQITKSSKVSYCQYIKNNTSILDNKKIIGKSTLYIIHSWEYEFVYIIKAIDYYIKKHYNNEPIYIYIDIFSNNPYNNININDNYLTMNVLLSIKQIGHTHIILSPYNESLTLKNIWNLFEIYCSITTTTTKISIGMIEDDKKKLDKELINDAFNILDKLTSLIRISTSYYNKHKNIDDNERDKMIIIDFIIKKVNDLNDVDLIIKNGIKNNIINFVKTEMNDNKYIDAYRLSMENTFAVFLLGQYKYDDALALFQSILKRRILLFGHFHEDVIYTITCTAALYTNMGLYDDAIKSYKDALDKYKKTVGIDHPSYFAATNNLANIYYNLGQFKEAESLHKQCYVRKQHALGDLHGDTLISLNNLAGIHRIQGKWRMAEQLYVKCLEAKKDQLGLSDLSTLSTMQCLASLYDDQKNFSKAEELYEICLMQRREILGEDDPSVLALMNNLAIIYMDQKKYDKAEELYRACLEKKIKTLTMNHIDTHNTMNGLGICLKKMGKFEESEKIFRESLRILVKNKIENNTNDDDEMITYTKENLDKLLKQVERVNAFRVKG